MKKVRVFVLFMFFCMQGTVGFPAEVIKNITWNQGPLVLDHQGNMYLGYDDYTITKYSPRGELVLKIGRKGEGPGDLKRIGSYAFNHTDKMLYVTEYYNGNRRVSRFSTDGKYAGAWPFEFNWSKYDIVSDIDFDTQGCVFLMAEKRKLRRYKDFVISNKVYDLLKFSPDGKFLKKIYTFNKDRDAEKVGNFQATIPFQNAVSWLVFRDKVIVKEITGDFIHVFSAEGELQKKIPFPVKKEKVTEKDIDAWEKRMKSLPSIKRLKAMGMADVDYWRERLPFPTYKPNTSGTMFTGPNENLYLEEYTRYKKKDPIWFKINLQTGKANTLVFKPGEELSGIRKGYFYLYKVIETEDDEAEMITRIKEEELLKRPL